MRDSEIRNKNALIGQAMIFASKLAKAKLWVINSHGLEYGYQQRANASTRFLSRDLDCNLRRKLSIPNNNLCDGGMWNFLTIHGVFA